MQSLLWGHLLDRSHGLDPSGESGTNGLHSKLPTSCHRFRSFAHPRLASSTMCAGNVSRACPGAFRSSLTLQQRRCASQQCRYFTTCRKQQLACVDAILLSMSAVSQDNQVGPFAYQCHACQNVSTGIPLAVTARPSCGSSNGSLLSVSEFKEKLGGGTFHTLDSRGKRIALPLRKKS